MTVGLLLVDPGADVFAVDAEGLVGFEERHGDGLDLEALAYPWLAGVVGEAFKEADLPGEVAKYGVPSSDTMTGPSVPRLPAP